MPCCIELAELVQRNHGAAAAFGAGHAERVTVGFALCRFSRPDQWELPSVSMAQG